MLLLGEGIGYIVLAVISCKLTLRLLERAWKWPSFSTDPGTGMYVIFLGMVLWPIGIVVTAILHLFMSKQSYWSLIPAKLHESKRKRAQRKAEDKVIRPLKEELAKAQAILERVAALPHQNLPEVKQARQFAEKTVKSLDYALTHERENAARIDALDHLEDLVELAQTAKIFHQERHEMMEDYTKSKLGRIGTNLKALEAGDQTPTPPKS